MNVLRLAACSSVYLPTLVFLIGFNHVKKQYRPLLWYLLVTSAVETYGIYTFLSGSTNNIFVYNVYSAVEIVLFVLIYKPYINHRPGRFIIYIIDMSAFIYLGYLLAHPHEYTGIAWFVESAFMFIICGLYVIETFRTDAVRPSLDMTAMGMLIFQPLASMVFLFGQINNEYIRYGWCLVWMANIFMHLSITWGILLEKRK